MQSLAFSANHSSAAFFYNTPQQQTLQSISPYYLNMFNPVKQDASVLGKRPHSSFTNAYQDEVQKRIRTSVAPNGYINPAFMQRMSYSFHQMVHASNFQQEIPCKIEGTKQEEVLSTSYRSANDQSETSHQSPKAIHANFCDSDVEEISIKEEYLKIEEAPVKEEYSDCPRSSYNDLKDLENTSTCEVQSQSSLSKTPVETPAESALFELTKMYPDWDLVTILRFIENGNSADNLEMEQKIKQRKSTLRNRPKVEPSVKIEAIQHGNDFDEDYRPGKSIKIKFRQGKKGTKAPKNLENKNRKEKLL